MTTTIETKITRMSFFLDEEEKDLLKKILERIDVLAKSMAEITDSEITVYYPDSEKVAFFSESEVEAVQDFLYTLHLSSYIDIE